jgi:hypothetical protein
VLFLFCCMAALRNSLRNLKFPFTHYRSSFTSTTGRIVRCNMTISRELLQKQNAETSNALIEHFKDSPPFAALAKYEGDLTIRRDQEDAVKLEKGIDFAKNKGVIDPAYVPEPYVQLDVLGKTPDIVAGAILAKVKANKDKAGEGSVIVLCGLSGTGKVSAQFIDFPFVSLVMMMSNDPHFTICVCVCFRELRLPSCVKNWKMTKARK